MGLTKEQKETKRTKEVVAVLEERLEEMGDQKVTIPLVLEAENLMRHIKVLKQQYT